MSPVFAHGRLRLYLLKLLAESPRHGYEVIRLLQDRFLGVYSPSPGTIYPRLARLEEEGLVTHEVVRGRKVYALTDAGRAELHRRLDELAALESELTEATLRFARGVKQDVRETVAAMRQELSNALRGTREDATAGAGTGAAAEDGSGHGDAPQGPQSAKHKSVPTGKTTLAEILRSFASELNNAFGGTEPTEVELRRIKADLARTVERIRRNGQE